VGNANEQAILPFTDPCLHLVNGSSSMSNALVLLNSLFVATCVAFVLYHSTRLGRLTLLDWALICIAGVYGVGWVFVALVTENGNNSTWEHWLLPFKNLYPFHSFASILLAFSIVVGWFFVSTLRFFSRKCSSRTPRSTEFRLILVMWLLLFIAVFVQWIYSRAYGGFLGVIEYSSLIRSSSFETVPTNSFSFLSPFGGLALFSSFGFFGLLLGIKRRLNTYVGLVLSSVFSVYMLYSWLGRIGFLVYLLSFILGLILYRRPRPLKLILLGLLVMLSILFGAYYVSLWFEIKAADDFHSFLAREISFPFVSFFAQLDLGEHLFRGFKDFIVAPMHFFPSSLLPEWVGDVSGVNTVVILGALKGEGGVTGGIPVDLLTLGLMQASFFGVAVVGAMFGMLLYFVQSMLDEIPHAGVRAVFEAYIILKIAVLGVFYAQPSLFVSGNFALFVTVGLIFIFLNGPRVKLFSTTKFSWEKKHAL